MKNSRESNRRCLDTSHHSYWTIYFWTNNLPLATFSSQLRCVGLLMKLSNLFPLSITSFRLLYFSGGLTRLRSSRIWRDKIDILIVPVFRMFFKYDEFTLQHSKNLGRMFKLFSFHDKLRYFVFNMILIHTKNKMFGMWYYEWVIIGNIYI